MPLDRIPFVRWFAWLIERFAPTWLRTSSMLAMRYLGRPDRLSWKYHSPTLVIEVLFGIALVLTQGLTLVNDVSWLPVVYAVGPYLHWLRLGLGALGVLVFVYISYIRLMTLSSTFSSFVLFLGVSSLIVVLSIMSGFDTDLRDKIVGLHAHIVVTKEDGVFDNQVAIEDKLRAYPQTIGVSAYLSDEVIVTSSQSSSAVLLKGIDLQTIDKVSDLGKKLDVGELSLLGDPEKLRDFRTPTRFLPSNDEPKKTDDDSDSDDEAESKPDLGKKPGDNVVDRQAFVPAVKLPTPPPIPDGDVEEPRRALPGILIGRELARTLRAYVGDEVSLVSPLGGIGPQGAMPKSKPFRIAGIFFTGMYEYDSKYAFITLAQAQRFSERPDEITGIDVKIRDINDSETVAAAMGNALGKTFEVRDWRQTSASLFAALKLERILMFIVLCFIALLAAFSIIANGVVLVSEKKREIAMLLAMGIERRSIVGVFMLLGTMLSGIGILSGVVVGVASCYALSRWGFELDRDVYYITKLPVQISPGEIATICLACFGLTLLGTIVTAVLGARVLPADGIRR